MERIRRNERMAALTRLLTTSPNQIYTLSHFCEMFGAAKSTLSEDIDILRDVFKTFGLGRLDTVTGAAGGVRFRPYMPREEARAFLSGLCEELQTPARLLPGGFLYLSDILSMPEIVRKMGVIIAGEFYDAAPDFVLTMETKGIPVALMAAQSLGVPREQIITLDLPKDTEEEAAAVKQAIGDAPFLLVTSASHLPRAMIFFQQEGLNPLPAPANQLAIDSPLNPWERAIPSPVWLMHSDRVGYETLGRIWQWLKGSSGEPRQE